MHCFGLDILSRSDSEKQITGGRNMVVGVGAAEGAVHLILQLVAPPIAVAAAAAEAPGFVVLVLQLPWAAVPPRGLRTASSGELLAVEPTPPVGRVKKQDG